MNLEYLFFDLDGTIMKTDEGVTNSFRYAVKELKMNERTFPFGRTDLYMGPSLEHFLTNDIKLSPEKAQEFISVFRVYYKEQGVFQCQPYKGAPKLLQDCKNAGYKVYICTSKFQPMAEKMAKEQGFYDCLDGLMGASDKAQHKSDILRLQLSSLQITDIKTCAMIGDRYTDLQGGADNNTSTIGVLYGYGDKKELEAFNPLYIAKTVADLSNFLLEN